MPRVVVIINGICFFLPYDAAIYEIACPGESNLDQLSFGEFNQVVVTRSPKAVVLKAEIFETVTNLLRLGHHLRRPGTEVLNPADFDTWIVNVDPVVIEHLSIFQDQHYGEEIAVPEALGSVLCSLADAR